MSNIARGALAGCIMGTLAFIISGPALAGSGVGGALIGAVYIGGGSIGGAVAGVLSRYAAGWFRSGIIGIMAFLPIVSMIFAIESRQLGTAELKGIGIVSVVLGFPGGIIARYLIRRIDPFGDYS